MQKPMKHHRIPIPREIVEEIAARQNVDYDDLVEALVAVDDAVSGMARTLRIQQVTDEEGNQIGATIEQRYDCFKQYVETEDWERILGALSEADDLKSAAHEAHLEAARKAGADEEILERMDAIGMWDPLVYDLLDVGLSFNQARIYTLKRFGLTHQEITEYIGMPKGTVDTHSTRVRKKERNAERLLAILNSGTYTQPSQSPSARK